MIKALSIHGFRGFGEKQTLTFSLPDGRTVGRGLNIITGANNTGKTTIIESIRAFNGSQEPTFSEGRRNIQANGRVELKLVDEKNREYSVVSVPGGGSSTKRTPDELFQHSFYILQSRRFVPFEFGKSVAGRKQYIEYASSMRPQRSASLEQFEFRIFQIDKNRERFDLLIKRLLGQDFQWAIEQRDSGQYYIKYTFGSVSHSSEGIGDGIWSIFTICAALFDSEPNTTIVIDEPELSIHPALQKKLKDLLLEYSARLQIIICTHSPYFVDWLAIENGAQFIRVTKEGTNSLCYQIQENSRKTIRGLNNDLNNPHILGMEASEVFFMEDGIILVEGQEDVVIYNKISAELGIPFEGSFFGWGVGGANRMNVFLALFKELGYRKIVAIFDGDKKSEAQEMTSLYPEYHFIVLAENDVRDKKERSIIEKTGITNEKGILKNEYREYAQNLIKEVNKYLSIYR